METTRFVTLPINLEGAWQGIHYFDYFFAKNSVHRANEVVPNEETKTIDFRPRARQPKADVLRQTGGRSVANRQATLHADRLEW